MKLFISSVENGELYGIDILNKHKCKYFLYSYIYLQRHKDPCKYMKVDGEVFVDSGAHTLQKPGKAIDWDKFVDGYINYINLHSADIDYFVELDIENKVGLPQVEKWTRLIEQKTGRQPIVVWHRARGWDYFKYMCKKYDYVGFSGFVEDNSGDKEVPDKFIKLFIDTAHQNGAKIHGFGYTRPIIKLLNFDSVDSSSWKSGILYGNISKFEKGRIKNVKQLKGVVIKENYYKIMDYSAREWVKYQYYLEQF
jgi:hypothetical protein